MKKGFTLIEILIVVAIIGILSTIVLASMGDTRIKAKNARIAESMSSLRTAGELYKDRVKSYLPVNAGNCSTGMFSSPEMKKLIEAIAADSYDTVSSMICNSDGNRWAVSVGLEPKPPKASIHWCADSNGGSNLIPTFGLKTTDFGEDEDLVEIFVYQCPPPCNDKQHTSNCPGGDYAGS